MEHFFATCPRGLEPLLLQELDDLGVTELRAIPGGVRFCSDWEGCARVNLNLPDAPDGEVVDMILSHKIPSIVLTGSMDKEVREAILKKEVIDYVFKGNIDDVNYIFALIERLHKNRGIKVLVVDDSIATRAHIKALLQQQMFTVLVAAHGNSLRGIIKYLKNISDEDIVNLNLPTGIPYVFEFDDNLTLIKDYFLGDEEEIRKLMEAVANQGKSK